MSPAEFLQQQNAVLRNQAQHEARYPAVYRPKIDTTYVVDQLGSMSLFFPAGSVVSNALLDAMRVIEADIVNAMKEGH